VFIELTTLIEEHLRARQAASEDVQSMLRDLRPFVGAA
jgi:hypothetical protein